MVPVVRAAAEFHAHPGPLNERLPGDALIEFVFGDRFNLWILPTDRRVDPVPERWSARGHQARQRCWLAQMGQDVADGVPIGEEGDDSYFATTALAGERKDLIDPREQQRLGVAGGATGDPFLVPRCFLCPLVRRARRSGRAD